MNALLLCLAISAVHADNLYQRNIRLACNQATHIIDASDKYNIDPTILAALIFVESRWDPTAVSRSNACGLTQVIPRYVPETCKKLKDPSTSIYAGARILNYWLVQRKKSKIKETLACYNVGNKCSKSKPARKYARAVLSLSRKYKKYITGITYKKLKDEKNLPSPPLFDSQKKTLHYALGE